MGDNYSLVVKLLKESFGKKEGIIESKLQNLHRTGGRIFKEHVMKLRKF